jgi:hypothetical protein
MQVRGSGLACGKIDRPTGLRWICEVTLERANPVVLERLLRRSADDERQQGNFAPEVSKIALRQPSQIANWTCGPAV